VIETITPVCVFGMLASFTYFMSDLRAAILPEGVGFMQWTLFFFILAAVGLNRIRRRQEEHGCSWVILSLLLAVVTLMALTARSGSVGAFTGQRTSASLALLINLGVVALIWFGADRITGDCSLDGWTEESVAEGLLTADGGRRRKRVKRPGLLIVILALPAAVFFGLARVVLPRAAAEVQSHAWAAAGAYLFFSLVLLALTSARLQRLYLTARKVNVTWKVMVTWIAAGMVIAALSLGLARALPKPNLAAMLVARATSATTAAGRALPLPPGGTRGPRPGEGQDMAAEGDQGRLPGEEGEGRGTGGQPEEEPEGQGGAGAQARNAQGRGEEGKGNGAEKGAAGGPARRSAVRQLGSALGRAAEFAKKLLTILIILALVVAAMIFFFPRLLRAWKKLGGWRSWWQRFLERFRRKPRDATIVRAPPRRFINPFRSARLLKRMSPRELARYTYEAFLAYAGQQGYPRSSEETPYEFAKRLSDSGAKMAPLAASAAEAYVPAEYGARELPDSALEQLRDIWKGLEAYAP